MVKSYVNRPQMLIFLLINILSITSFRMLPLANRISHKILMNAITTSKDDVAIIGGGPAGLASAIMLARRGYKNIRVYEKLDRPLPPTDPSWSSVDSERTYNIGISGRGQNVLKSIDAMSIIDNHSTSVIGRTYWDPDTPPEMPLDLFWTNRTYVTKCIPRDCLASCLLSDIYAKYNNSITVYYNTQCFDVTWTRESINMTSTEQKDIENWTETAELSLQDSKGDWFERTSFLIGADGATSAVREAMTKTLKNQGTMLYYVYVYIIL